ncbi:response regulator [Faecalimonas sp.]
MNKPLILVVDDDKAIRSLITTILEAQEYRFHAVSNGMQGLLEVASQKPDVLLLDLGLPDIDGIEVIQKVRSWSNVPIIVISSRSEDKDKILALDSGADDYLTKPFSVDELLARIRVVLRRENCKVYSNLEQTEFINGELRINYVSGCAYVKERELHLTPIEYKLLVLLSKNVGKVMTHTYLTREIWGNSWESDVASLRVFMATLRKKIEENPQNPQYIQTHVGVGYRMIRVPISK